ncbi:MAG: MFS transporter [Desulfosudaceae bacterium]
MMTETRHNNSDNFYAWKQLWPILFVSLIFFLTFVARTALSPLMPSIEAELDISHRQAGGMFFVLAAGYFAAMMGSGLVSARLTHRYTIALSATLVGLALLVLAAGRGLWPIRGGVFFLGVAAGLYLPSGITTLTDMVNSRHWGKAVAIHELAPNLGFVAAPLLAELLMLWFSWRMVLLVIGSATIVIGLVFGRLGRWGCFPGQPPRLASVKELFSRKSFWLMVILFGLAISSTMGVYNMLPLYLTNEIGISRSLANTFMAFSRVAGLGTALLSGWATDRFGARRTIISAFALTGAATLLLGMLSSPAGVILMVFLQAVLSTIYFPAGFTALSSLFSVDIRNVAIAFTIPLAFLFGSGLIPAMIGFFGDAGSFSIGFVLTGGLILVGAPLSLFLKLRQKSETGQQE